jgi:hypothetical protein
MVDAAEVEKRTELVKARSIEIGTTLGGIVIQSVNDLEQISLRLARGMVAVPAHCRDNPGVVYALCMQALEWGMPIMSVINKSYVPRGGDRIGFESQLLHAVIEKNAPLKGRLRYEILGEGTERRCKVWGTFNGEEKPHEYISEPLSRMHPGHVTKDNVKYVKGSPLWDSNPEVQMFYSASRQWARLFASDVLLGAYTPEELESAPPMQDVTPVTNFQARLEEAKKARAGNQSFDATKVNSIIEGEANPGVVTKEAEHDGSERKPDLEGGQDLGADRSDDDQHARGVGEAGIDTQGVGEAAPREAAARGEGEAEAGGEGEVHHSEARAAKPKGKRK